MIRRPTDSDRELAARLLASCEVASVRLVRSRNTDRNLGVDDALALAVALNDATRTSDHQPRRCHVDQPSDGQPLHARHGENVLATPDGEGYLRVYPLSGDVVSLRVPASAIAAGWRS